jgi:hypothetical protein
MLRSSCCILRALRVLNLPMCYIMNSPMLIGNMPRARCSVMSAYLKWLGMNEVGIKIHNL